MSKGRVFGGDAFEVWTTELLELESAHRQPDRPAKAKEEGNDS